ncbi:MAG: hypothetical protein JWO94_684 [Verrucomicrobiaceae bacterium]|nr:hypothetical protein [Verrucomicrobiaceae bacterium]
MKKAINSFNAGEVSPLLIGRTDLDSLTRAAVQIRNFLPVSTGGVIRRPSLMHVTTSDTLTPETAASASMHSRLIPFTFSTGLRYMIQVSSSWIKVFRSDGTLAQRMPFGLGGAPVTLTGCATSSGSATVTCPSTLGLAAGMAVFDADAGIPSGTIVAAPTDATHFLMNQKAVISSTGMTLSATTTTTISSLSFTSASATVTCASTSGILVGMVLSSLTAVPPNTFVTSITDSLHFVMSQPALATITTPSASGTLTIPLTNCTLTAGSTTASCASTTGLVYGMVLVNPAIFAGSKVLSISSDTQFVMDQAASTSGGGQALAFSLPYEVYTYWPAVSPFNVDEISYAQVNDVLFLAHAAFPTLMLGRHGDCDWRMTSFATDFRDAFWPPMLDEQVTSEDPADVVEGMSVTRAFSPSLTSVYGGITDAGAAAVSVTSFPCPSTLRLYLSTLPFSGSIQIQGADLYGPITVASCVTVVASATLKCPSTALFTPGMTITGTGIPAGATVAAITDPTHVVLTAAATAAGTITVTLNATTWTTIHTLSYTASNLSNVLQYQWWHTYAYLRIVVTGTSGSGTYNLVHVGSKAAPTFWVEGYTGLPQNSSRAEYLMRSSPPAFADYSVSETVQIGHLRRDNLDDITLAGTGAVTSLSSGLFIFGDWEAYSTGIWAGVVYLEALDPTGRWDVIRTWSGNKDYNFSASGTEVPGRRLRLRAEITAAATSSGTVVYPRFSLKAVDGLLYQWGRVSSTNGSSQLYLAPMNGVDLATLCHATTAVSRGAFSDSQGYPSSVCIHDERVYFGGTPKRPTSIWASGVDDLLNFRRTGYDDGGFLFQIAANEGNAIQSMVSASRGIVLLTAGDEWLIDGADTGVTPTNITARRQSRYGCAALQAIPAGGSLLFVQRGGLALRDYLFDWTSQNFDSPELTELIKHLTTSGIRSIAYSQNPEGMIWCVMNDGSLLTCSYNRKQQVIAWAKHSTQAGLFESVAVIYGSNAQSDDVWFVVNRNGRRRIEKLDSSFWASLYNGGTLYHLDGAVMKAGTPFNKVAGLNHLEGLTVRIIADGVLQPPAVVSGGSVPVPAGTTSAQAGLGFTSTLQPMPFDMPLPDGTMAGRQVHAPAAAVRFYRTSSGQYADSPGGEMFDFKLPGADYTGIMPVRQLSRVSDVFQMVISTSSPLPLNVLALVPSFNVYG